MDIIIKCQTLVRLYYIFRDKLLKLLHIINCLTFVQSRGRRRNAGLPFFADPVSKTCDAQKKKDTSNAPH